MPIFPATLSSLWAFPWRNPLNTGLYYIFMSILKEILQGVTRGHLTRSGMASRCRLALQCVAEGRSAVLLVRTREEYNAARGLLTLFSEDISHAALPVERVRWQSSLLFLPPGVSGTGLQASSSTFWAERMATLYALQYKKPSCLVLTVESLLLKYMPQSFFAEHELILQKGADMSPELVVDQAVNWGYERVQMVSRPGELAQRGDILDIFPPGYEKPIRLEFFGDMLEDMRLFDAVSQRSLLSVPEITVLAPLPIAASQALQQKALQRWERLLQKGMLDENHVHDFKKNLHAGGGALLPGTFYDAPTVLEEWLAKDCVWLLPGEADTREELESTARTLAERMESEESAVPQPGRMVLRDVASVFALWEGAQVLHQEPLVMGSAVGGALDGITDSLEQKAQGKFIDLQEKQVHTFADLFMSGQKDSLAERVQDRPWQQLIAGLKAWQAEKRQVLLSFATERSRAKFLALAEQDGLLPHLRYAPQREGIFALVAPWRSGVDLIWDNVRVLGEDILYPKAEKRTRTAAGAFRGLDRFDDLTAGDLLVHRDYGIARFAGLHHMDVGQGSNDYLLLEYSGADKLYVPADRLSLIQRFKGGDGVDPALDRLGGASWQSSKDKARKAIEKIAADLVEMYALRKVTKGFSYGPPDELFHEFEATFGFEETPDQAKAIQDVLDDMAKNEPMDRLVCGDVGFGKTEVALRASFRAAAEGRQVALLCPTTVLAEQHYQTFRQRLAGFPINVGLLSRFVSKQKQKDVLKAAEQGQIDIVVGTHRLLSKDVTLPNLGLLILDEEQRFGVRHKEKLKALKKNVDALTLTATPIPRTLQLSMSGIRELSVIETAPPERKPVSTAILQRDGKVLKEVLEREIQREGQVFWVYNRVQGLERVAEYVRNLVPTARIGMAHGQMGEKELEETMHKFWHGELDVLVCTSIVESGLDFPRANTLIVDQAHMFGLGQLYQLRGRVGRSDRQAYAFFVVPEEHRLSDTARERLRIILELDYLGAGFQVAMEDLRLRGAGNILGEVQSGHMTRLGLDLFLEMLEEAVSRLKGTPSSVTAETELTIGVPAHIPKSYVQDGRERLRYYKALSSAVDGAAREEVSLAMRDRFGSFPVEFENFLAVLRFKQLLGSLAAHKADIYAHKVVMHWDKNQKSLDTEALVALMTKGHASGAKLRPIPPASLEITFAKPKADGSDALSLVQHLDHAGSILLELRKKDSDA